MMITKYLRLRRCHKKCHVFIQVCLKICRFQVGTAIVINTFIYVNIYIFLD